MNITFMDYAVKVLSDTDKPLTHKQIWEKGVEKGFDNDLKTTGKTPWSTLGARLYVGVDEPDSKIVKVSNRPARFFLKSRQGELSENIILEIEKSETEAEEKLKPKYFERDLHPLVSYFAHTNPTFNPKMLTKTIFHEKSRKSNKYNEWIHPDLVGFHLPLEEWGSEVTEFNRISDNNALKLFSFELKRAITGGNYREAFFQAVSNSSWANEGYLIAAEIKQDDELLAELGRLSTSFGIGIIHLDISDIDSSKVLFQARNNPQLDWEAINKLCTLNIDFKAFLEDVKIDFDSQRIHKGQYDEIINPEVYIKDKNML